MKWESDTVTVCRRCSEVNGEMWEIFGDDCRRCPYCGRFTARIVLVARVGKDGSRYFEEEKKRGIR